ncbi:hypothetical protein [Clostridium sp. CMCC3677]|uniref:hypothetical protein n=1 Tax=Clostridium sp. CMCC3677 TaxID=2949963 RepID=UPI00207A32F9|nr:hypothetical protein [Clostridium sp. CMCC3677]
MILIRCNDIKNWNVIKEYHKEFFLKKVQREIQKEMPLDKNSKKYLLFNELFLSEQDQVDEEKLFELAVGNKEILDEIIEKYREIIFKQGEEIIYELINKFIYNKNKKVEKIKKSLEKLIDKLNEEEKEIFDELTKTAGEKIESKAEREKIVRGSVFGDTYNEIHEIKQSLEKIFNYEGCFGKKGIKLSNEIQWNRHELLFMMGISVCPYCNREYINNYFDDTNKRKSTADLDHFYPKSKYPFLALSLYNFIPSCQICNSRFKGDEDFYEGGYIYPYEEEFGDEAKFKTDFYTNEDIKKDEKELLKEEDAYDISYLLGNSNNFKIEIDIKYSESEIGKKIYKSKNIFHLEDLYNSHKDYIREIIKKAIIYNESRIDELYAQYPELFNSREEVLQMVVSNYIDSAELGKRPLSKLTKDICEELGLR